MSNRCEQCGAQYRSKPRRGRKLSEDKFIRVEEEETDA